MSKTPPFPEHLAHETGGAELAPVWDLLQDDGRAVGPEETDAAWARLARATVDAPGAGSVEPLAETPAPMSPRLRRGFGIAGRAAAAILLAVGLTGAWYAIPVTHTAGAGDRAEITLPDGSRVTLNAGSTLSHRRGFSWLPGLQATRRVVSLEGEAFFDVNRAVRSFVVETPSARVRVLGTRFNVRARQGKWGPTTARVEVEEGSVEVTDPARAYSVVIRPGQAVTVNPAAEMDREAVDTRRIAPWRGGGLALIDEPLSAVLRELALRFDTDIALLDEGAADARLNVYYQDLASLEIVLSDLATQQDLRYRRTATGWELF